jgi:hypothetical protein
MSVRTSPWCADERPRSVERELEDELRDPKYFLEYFLPRPLRLVFCYSSAASCFLAILIGAATIAGSGIDDRSELLRNLVINTVGFGTFLGLGIWDQSRARVRVEQRASLRKAQIAFGDR